MTQDTNVVDPVDLDALKAQVAKLEAAQKAGEREKATHAEFFTGSLYPEIPPTGFAGARLRAQNAERELRERATAEVEAECRAHLAGSAQKRARMEKQMAELAAQRRAEEQRHREAIEPLDEKCDALRKQHDQLFRAPVTLGDVLARKGYVAERQRIQVEEISETLPVGLGITAEQVLEARRRMVGVRG